MNKQGRTRFKAYITKYALTQGIQVVEVVDCFDISERMVSQVNPKPGFGGMNYHKPHWHLTLEEARAHAEEMKRKKLASTEKQIKKLRETEIPVKDLREGSDG